MRPPSMQVAQRSASARDHAAGRSMRGTRARLASEDGQDRDAAPHASPASMSEISSQNGLTQMA